MEFTDPNLHFPYILFFFLKTLLRYKQPRLVLTFANLYTQQPFFNQTSPTFENFSETQPEPDIEVVPKTQPDPQPATSRQRHRRKDVLGKTTKSTITRWTEVEELAQARANIDVSEDPFVGNNQTSTEFWKHVRAQFFATMGRDSYKTNDMISGK
ncbi:hypothetical protein R6Q59_035809 [Mikania micrantha]